MKTIVLLCGLVLLSSGSKTVSAATLELSEIALGKIVTINGMKFAKTGVDPVKGSQFTAICESNSCGSDPQCTACSTTQLNVCEKCSGNYAPIGGVCTACPTGTISVGNTCVAGSNTMQSWDGCSALATPAATGYTQGPTLIDERDGKSYEIRKFADGKCWMADNLMYGGETDNCAGVGAAGYTDAAYGGSNGMATPSNRFGANTYGNCRDPRVGGVAPCTPGSTVCGYYYNWQAALQLPTAYYNTSVSYPNGTPSTTNHLQGICPEGWHLPSGGKPIASSEFAQLDIANGGTGGYQNSCTTASCNFWRPGYSYKSVYTGASINGSASISGNNIHLWAAGETSATHAVELYVDSSNYKVIPGIGEGLKNLGFMVRCIKD